jgi:hypothetical protein
MRGNPALSNYILSDLCKVFELELNYKEKKYFGYEVLLYRPSLKG